MLVTKDTLEGLTCPKTNRELDAYQQVTIDELPYVLLLHLKCFEYKQQKLTKIVKNVEFSVDLKIEPSEYFFINCDVNTFHFSI
jgi:ubiquitin carboxyl-terminal hydrolase 10